VSPVTNQVSEHLISNIPHFVTMFLADTYTNPTGKYFERSPIMHATRQDAYAEHLRRAGSLYATRRGSAVSQRATRERR